MVKLAVSFRQGEISLFSSNFPQIVKYFKNNITLKFLENGNCLIGLIIPNIPDSHLAAFLAEPLGGEKVLGEWHEYKFCLYSI